MKLIMGKKHPSAGINTPQFPNLQKFKGLVETPQFPGVDVSQAIEMVRSFIKNQKRAKGFQFDIVAGPNTGLNIELSGSARMLLGFAITQTVTTVGGRALGITLTVNNDLVLDDINIDKFGPEFTDQEFYFYPRQL